ncbi:hypothetical protein DWA07_20730, partial [Acinetobacter baumannii]
MTYKEKLDAGIPFRVISISVYRTSYGGHISDCTNEGVSKLGTDTLYIPCEEGPDKSTEVDRTLIMEEEQRGKDYWALKPIDKPTGMVGPMSGGNL